MMQRRWQHGSSGELDVFGATSYFTGGGLPDFPSEPDADWLIQESKVRRVRSNEDEQLGLQLHDDEGHAQLGVVANKPSSGKTKLASLLSFVVSPSPRASFRKESPPPPPEASNNKMMLAAAGDEPAKASSWSLSSRESSVHELDLGAVTGDRRLQGIRVVRGSGEERWVVKCSAWKEEEHHNEGMLDDAGSGGHGDEVEEGDDAIGNPGDWESDSSSDLFDLDIEYLC